MKNIQPFYGTFACFFRNFPCAFAGISTVLGSAFATGLGAAVEAAAGFGVGAREPSDPRRRPQHRGDGAQPPARARHR